MRQRLVEAIDAHPYIAGATLGLTWLLPVLLYWLLP